MFIGTALVSNTFKPLIKGHDNDREGIGGSCNAACAILNEYGSQYEGNLRF